MKITVSGESKEYRENITVAELIEAEKVENAEYVTVTLNDEFLDRENFNTPLKENDSVEFLFFMGGGKF